MCRSLLPALLVLAVPLVAVAQHRVDPAQATPDEQGAVLWYDAQLLPLEGKGWEKTKSYYDRLPPKAEQTVRPPVWSLSRHSAGMLVRFVTDAPEIHARWSLTSPRLAMPHMPATGVSGLDLYVRTDEGRWRWLAVGRPTKQENRARLVAGISPRQREYALYLPLYNGVKKVEIGIPKNSSLWTGPPRPAGRQKPIVFYGTSITQGGCASRPGMVHTAILGRWFDRPVINLGFSGNGRMELEVAELISELDAAVYVIDCLPNITGQDVTARTAPLVKKLRAAHPETPILLVEDRNYTDSFLVESKRTRNRTSQTALKVVFEQLQQEGVKHLHYLAGAKLLGDDGEGTVDSSHPTDLGFYRQAQAFRQALEPLLKEK